MWVEDGGWRMEDGEVGGVQSGRVNCLCTDTNKYSVACIFDPVDPVYLVCRMMAESRKQKPVFY